MLTQSEFPHMCWVAVCSLCCPTAESLLCNCTVTECSWYVWLVCVCGSCMLSSVYAKFCVSGMGLGNVRGVCTVSSVWVEFAQVEWSPGSGVRLGPLLCVLLFFLPFMGRIFSGSGLFLRSRQTRLRQSWLYVCTLITSVHEYCVCVQWGVVSWDLHVHVTLCGAIQLYGAVSWTCMRMELDV